MSDCVHNLYNYDCKNIPDFEIIETIHAPSFFEEDFKSYPFYGYTWMYDTQKN